MQPTVGRKVYFSPTANDGVKLGEQPFDATVIYVHNDRLINIAYRDHMGTQFSRTDVPLLQDDDAPLPDGGHCYWMPYQKGQAAKTEELENAQAAGAKKARP